MFISGSLYPLVAISPSSEHQLMCVALKSNLYHLNESKAPQQNCKPHINSPAATFKVPDRLSWALVASWDIDVVPSAGFPLPVGH